MNNMSNDNKYITIKKYLYSYIYIILNCSCIIEDFV